MTEEKLDLVSTIFVIYPPRRHFFSIILAMDWLQFGHDSGLLMKVIKN